MASFAEKSDAEDNRQSIGKRHMTADCDLAAI